MTEPKPKLEMSDLHQLEELANHVGMMPDGPEKDAQKARLKEFTDFVLTKRDLPAEPIALEKPFVALLDYLPGLARTAVGEGALALAGKNTMQGAKERALDAVVPDFIPGMSHLIPQAGRPAPSSGEYRKLLGYGNEQSPAMAENVLPDNFPVNASRGKTLDFLSDMFLDPNIMRGAYRGLRYGKAGAMADKAGMTLEEARAALNEELQKKYNMGSVEKGARTAGSFLMDPAGTIGEGMYNWRFRNADRAARELNLKLQRLGKPMQFKPMSQVMSENGRPGFTSQGIKEGVDNIIANKENAIDELHAPNDVMPPATRPQSQVLEPLYGSDVERRIRTPGTTGAFNSARGDILDEFRDTMREDPAIMAAYEEAKSLAGTPVYGPNGEILRKSAEPPIHIKGQPQTHTLYEFTRNEALQKRPGVKVEFNYGDTVPDGWKIVDQPGGGKWLVSTEKNLPPKRVVTPQDREFMGTSFDPKKTTTESFPGRDVTQPGGEIAMHPAPGDLLDFADTEFKSSQLRDISRNYQQKARASNFYSKPSKFDVKTKANNKAIEENMALGELQNKVGGQARDLEMKTLEEMQPGAGAQVFENYKDISGLMQGAPYIDRPYNSSVNNAYLRPTSNAAVNFLVNTGRDLGGAGATTVGKTLMSPAVKYSLLPAVRAGMVESTSEYNRNNPWEVVRKLQRGE